MSPSLEDLDLALVAYAAEVAALRREGLTSSLPRDGAEHIFALSFALEQLHQNFRELAQRVNDWAESSKLSDPPVTDRATD